MDELFKFISHPIVGMKIAWIYASNGGKEGIEFLEKFDQANKFVVSKDYASALKLSDELVASSLFSGQKASLKADIYVMRSAAHGGLKDLNKAIDDCEAAISILPEKAEAHENLGVFLTRQKRFNQALGFLDRAVELNPKRPSAYVNRAFTLLKMEQTEEALLNCQIALGLDPDHLQANLNSAGIKVTMGRNDEALAHCLKVLKIDPNNSTTLINRGVIFMRQGKLKEALADFNRGISLDPKNALGYADRAGVLLKLKRYEESIADCDRALAIDDQNSIAWMNKVSVLKRMKKNQEAINLCRLALQQDLSKDIRIKLSSALAGALTKVGDFAPAVELCDKAILEDYKDHQAYNVRAWTFAHMGEFEKASADVQQALELAPNNPAYIGTAGLVLLGQGRYNEALASLTKAVELSPSDSESFFFRARTYRKLGEDVLSNKDAEKYFEAGYELPARSYWRNL